MRSGRWPLWARPDSSRSLAFRAFACAGGGYLGSVRSLTPRLVWGATLFATPGMKSGGVHTLVLLTIVFAAITVAVALALFQRSWRPRPPGPDWSDGGGWRPEEPPRDSPRGPRGRIPLEDAVPARVRLRGAGRLSDTLPAPSRRPVREPERRPVREKPRS